MTAAPRRGGMRAAGSSLLDQVLAETLDPAYARAAAAREGRPPPARRRGGRLAVALVMVVAGLLAAVTYHQTAAGSEGRQQIRAALIADIVGAQEVTDDLAADLDAARAEVAAAREEALAASDEGQAALATLAQAEQAAAAVPVTGPGLLVLLADAAPDADGDPVGGDTQEDPRGKVRDGDLQLVVNALWAAGAEAVSINGQRLGPTTAIRFAGEAVLVDFRPVTSPYEVSAIGDPGTLRSEFLASPEVGSLAVISQSFGLRFEFSEEDELSLPAGRPPRLHAAEPPVEEAGAAADSAPTGATDPGGAPDPSPGG